MKLLILLMLLALLLVAACNREQPQTGRQCSEDNMGTVRIIDGSTKHVYRNECFGGILIDYGCKDGSIVSTNIRCQKDCALDKYLIGRCIE